jgi:hypothetical protein
MSVGHAEMPGYRDRCDGESKHLIKFLGPVMGLVADYGK